MITALLFFLLTSQTSSLSLDSIPLISFKNLKNQSSFNYKYQFKSDLPHNISGVFNGSVILPDQEQRQGILIREKKKNSIKIKARREYQYEISKKAKQWQIIPRGEESNILISIDRTIMDANFQLISENKESYTYKFIPNLSFLDPTFTRKFSAFLTVNKKTILPEKIIAQDSPKKILWQIEFSSYNKVKRIKLPFHPTTKIILSAQQKLGKRETSSIIETLKRRLELAGENFRLSNKIKDNSSLFIVDLELWQLSSDNKLIQNLLVSPGQIKVYPVIETTLNSEPLLGNTDINEFMIKTLEPYPMMEISLNSVGLKKMNEYLNLPDSQPAFQFFLDTIRLGTFRIDKSNFSSKLNIQIYTNKNEIMSTIAIIKGGTLGIPLKILSIEGGK